MRVLIVGAGVAGLTLASLLEQRGIRPVVVERAETNEGGYAIGLYPLGSCVLHGLGTFDELVERGLVVDRYELADHRGRVLQALDMSVLTAEIGPMVMIERTGLLDLLGSTCRQADIRRGRTVATLDDRGDHVEVVLDDGSREDVDLVVACDGINSATRQTLFGSQPRFDTGWVLHTWWSEAPDLDRRVVGEWWGRGWFFGVYPAPDRVMCAAGGPDTTWGSPGDPRVRLRQALAGLVRTVPAVGSAVEDAARTYRWPMSDVRSGRWTRGRVALCGDAAAGFLPTAGVGASNAMRAAAGLADELSRADAQTVPLALEVYEKRCRRTIEANQTESRRLARIMFLNRSRLGWLRDQAARRYPAEKMLSQIIDSARAPF